MNKVGSRRKRGENDKLEENERGVEEKEPDT